MINIGMMFKNIIPLELLAQLPRPFVHRLRDLRLKQMEETNKQQEQQSQAMMAMNRRNMRPPSNVGFGTSIDDIIDELT